ncbi:DUF72 domain-containing protein [Candidatus Entotheonella palauensis]|uniref:DUF72 domain-containing protein n=1 Tax=Candidatus Entotheonella palauensis TaxID=93172 RepID=UPI000B7ED471|nr:DUF72 domain-containing protein [Candidatus Entotheonella palauensis]
MQLDLFGAPEEPLSKPVVAPAEYASQLTAIARQLPKHIYFGTSSWAFEGWRGLVFAQEAPKTKLSRHGLAAYAQHPLFRAVGLDRTYYAPIAASDFADYAAMVPDMFRFLVKAHELCTLPLFRGGGRYAQRRGEANAYFLDASYATDHVVGPCVEGLQGKAGPLLFQFSPLSVEAVGGPQRFAEQLYAFLDALPRGPLYAVELRNEDLFSSSYLDALIATGAVHCFNVHPAMPPIHEQYQAAKVAASQALIIRWMLHPNYRYEAARQRYEPFDRLVDEDPENRQTIAKMCLDTAVSARPAVIIVNNKAEGSSPLTIQKLAETLVRMQ